MDRRYKPLSPHEQLKLRLELTETIEAHPEWSFVEVLKHIRKTLRLTLPEMAKVSRVSTQTLKNIEASTHSPSLATAERLLRPLGLRLRVAPRLQDGEGLPTAEQ